jgi:hypothetical protein
MFPLAAEREEGQKQTQREEAQNFASRGDFLFWENDRGRAAPLHGKTTLPFLPVSSASQALF